VPTKTVIAKNVTGSPVTIDDLGVTILGLQQKTLSDYFRLEELWESVNLGTLVAAGTIVINDGSSDLGITPGTNYITPVVADRNVDSELDSATSTATAGELVRWGVGGTIDGITPSSHASRHAPGGADAVATAAAVSVGTANAAGTAASLARSDHTHAVTGLSIASQARGDLLFFNGTAWVRLAPGTAGLFLQTSGAGADPGWATAGGSIAHSEVNAAGDVTTTSTSDVVVTSMSITPGAGSYIVYFSTSIRQSNNGDSVFLSVYANGVQVTNSQRQYTRAGGATQDVAMIMAKSTVAAGQAIDIRWRVNSNTGTLGNRALVLLKVA
jgi:hypothetical protein